MSTEILRLKNRKKEKKLNSELTELTGKLDTLRERLDEVQDNLEISARTLREQGGVY